MKSRSRSSLTRLRVATLVALACLAPVQAWADATVFQTDLTSGTNTDANVPPPGAITPSGSVWYFLSSKNATASYVAAGSLGLNLTHASSTAGGVEGIARFTTSPLSLSAIGDSITALATFSTNNIGYLAVGLYESGGIDPLTTLRNSGLSSTPLTVTTGGTLGWKGYRARAQLDSTAGSIVARAPQTGTSLTQLAHDVIAVNTGDFNSPGPKPIGFIPASAVAPFFADGSGVFYKLKYTLTRTAVDELKISYTIYDSADAIIYSTTSFTSNADARPSAITSTFDAFAIGVRNNAPGGTPTVPNLGLATLSITADNSQVTRIVNEPIPQSWMAGAPGSISVAATGAAPLTYQWYKDDVLIATATAATYTVGSPTVDNAGTYHVVVSNAYGASTSVDATVSLAAASAPVLTTEPAANVTVNASETLTLTSLASGAPTPSYQWFKHNGTSYVAIPGATWPTYTIPATATTDAGTYRVTATNGSGSDFADAVVTIRTAAPVITVEPTPVTVNVGQPVNISVTATGYPAPSYQWYKDTGSGPVLIPGATASAFTLGSATTADIGSYSVVATNSIGSDTSAAAGLTVTVVAPSITTPPANVTVALGQPATFTVAASGSAPLYYQWYKGTTQIEGATSASYTINATVGSSAGDYHVIVNNEGNVPATSASATLNLIVTDQTTVFATNFANDTINPSTPSITPTSTAWYMLSTKNARTCTVGDDPATPGVTEARPLTITLEGGSGSAFFQTATRFTNSPVSLAPVGSQLRVTTTFTTQNIRTFGFGLYNSGGSWPKQLDFDPNAGLTTPTFPPSEVFMLGTSGTTAVGSGTQNWIGYRSTLTELAGGGNVGHNISTRPAQTATTSNKGQELCVTGSGSISYNEPVGISVGVTTKTPASDAVGIMVDNNTYTLVYTISRSAADQFTISYQIYAGAGTGGTLFRSATGTTSTTAPVPPALGNRPSDVTQAFDAFAIGMRNVGPLAGPIPRFVFTNFQVVHSAPVEAIVPSITLDPVSQTIATGASFTLTATATGSPTPTLQWYKGVTALPGQTSSSYTVGSATVDDAGSYTVVATNAVGSDTSAAATITVSGGASAYDTWASGFALNPATNGAPGANPSGDGVVNLLKFVLGGNPTVAGSTVLPVAAVSGGNLTFTYNLETAATAEYSVLAQTSTDLITWTPAVHGTGGVSISTTPVDGNTNQVIVTVPQAGARLFARLQVSELP